MNVLVTGASGFTGHYLIRHLLSLGEGTLHVSGICRSAPQISLAGCTYFRADLNRREQVDAVIKRVSPDAVIHLAGLNRGTLAELLQTNVINTENLLEVVRKERPDSRILVVGSSAEYGYAGETPVTEDAPLRPVSTYGISKVAEDILALHYYTAYGLGVAVPRPFNLIGPGQSDSFVCGMLTRQAVEIRGGIRDAFELAGGEARRDFVDVRDVVDGYWKLICHKNFEKRVAGRAFNIGSGKSYSVSEVIQEISKITGISCKVYMRALAGRELVPLQMADTTLIEKETGWIPSTPLRRSLEEMISKISSSDNLPHGYRMI
jgi:GDP-4-dehydro-6-deoxy-D-mannose reductase